MKTLVPPMKKVFARTGLRHSRIARGRPPRRGRWANSAIAAFLACGLALAGCSDSGAEGNSAPESTVRVGILGGPSDTLDITNAATNLPYAVLLNVYDSLVLLQGGEFELQLAESVTPNEDATRWTIAIRDGVTFHDGSPLTSTDVLYSLKYLAESANFGTIYGDVDFETSTIDDDLTLTLHLTRPRADFVEAMLSQLSPVFPDGTTDFTSPVGSGPFKLESFSADSGAKLVRNEDYWGGAPAIEALEIVPIMDGSARLSALTDGQVDIVTGLSATALGSLEGNDAFVIDDPGPTDSSAFTFHMNTSIPPFDDPEVREALRIGIDRQALVDVVLQGTGEIGNDLIGLGLPGYADGVPQREYDPGRAEEIFAEHGVTELGIIVAELAPGLTDATKLLQQQLADLGVTLTITEADPSTLFSNLEPVYATQLFTNYFNNRPAAVTLPVYLSPDSPYNFSQWKDPEYAELLTQSETLVDDEARATALEDAQERLWAEGGDIVWGYQPNLGAHAKGLEGVSSTQSIPLFAEATITR
ncbi:ABC transporter substrate-binding protein [Actinomycetaceae bacterium L2_0104]